MNTHACGRGAVEHVRRIVEQELRSGQGRVLSAHGEADDVKQELLTVAWLAKQRCDGRSTSDVYVRVAVRNELKSLAERQRAAKRNPQDRYGRTMPLVRLDALTVDESESGEPMALLTRIPASEPSPEDTAEHFEILRQVMAQLPRYAQRELRAAVVGQRRPNAQLLKQLNGARLRAVRARAQVAGIG